MSETAIGSSSGHDGRSSESTDESVFESTPDFVDLRELADSGVLTGLGGAVTLARGFRSLRRGDTGRGLVRLAVGGALVAVAFAQRRAQDGGSGAHEAGGIDQTDVTGSSTDLDDVSDGLDTADAGTGGDSAEVVDTSPDLGDVSDGLDDESSGASATEAGGDIDATDVADVGPDVAGTDPDPDPGSSYQERADRSDANAIDAGTTVDEGTAAPTGGEDEFEQGTTDATDEQAGVSTDSGEVGVEEEEGHVEGDVDHDDEDEEESR